MNLSDFVSESILQIIDGVSNANKKIAEVGAEVGPRVGYVQPGSFGVVLDGGDHIPVTPVEFDVAVTVTESGGVGGKGGLSVGSLVSVSLGSSAQHDSQSVSRIKFSLPLCLPKGKHRQYMTVV